MTDDTPAKPHPYMTDREDGRYVSSLGLSHQYMRSLKQEFAFDSDMWPEDFPVWQKKVRIKLRELMGFPEVPPQPPPKRLWAEPRDGYTLEKWEVYPEPASVVPVLMLVPDGTTAEKPAPAVLCFPGSSGTKEYLANEPEFYPGLKVAAHADKNRMAFDFARAGMIAVAVDHPTTGETLERHGDVLIGGAHRDKLTRDLIYMGRSFVGLSSFQKMKVLEWLKTLPRVDAKRIAVSGHSLGTEPGMVLAALDPDVCAAVNNDFVHGKCEQDLALAPSMNGKHVFMTGGMWHCVPGLWQWFDLPDLLAAMAPRPLLVPEGGVAGSLANLRRAYELAGTPNNLEIHHFPKYDSPEKRPHDNEPIPEGLHIDEYYRRGNTDPPNHYFKGHIAVPWLARTLGVARAE
jgi:dienelactone hydrolase